MRSSQAETTYDLSNLFDRGEECNVRMLSDPRVRGTRKVDDAVGLSCGRRLRRLEGGWAAGAKVADLRVDPDGGERRGMKEWRGQKYRTDPSPFCISTASKAARGWLFGRPGGGRFVVLLS